jgi:hypothetical protein
VCVCLCVCMCLCVCVCVCKRARVCVCVRDHTRTGVPHTQLGASEELGELLDRKLIPTSVENRLDDINSLYFVI